MELARLASSGSVLFVHDRRPHEQYFQAHFSLNSQSIRILIPLFYLLLHLSFLDNIFLVDATFNGFVYGINVEQ
jgi:hypothetical protein